MYIKIRYCVEATPSLLGVLDSSKVRYKLSSIFDSPQAIFYLRSDDIRKSKIEREITSVASIIPQLVFSKMECGSADWVRLMPKYDKISFDETDLTFSYFCKGVNRTSSHAHQIGLYRLKRNPKWAHEMMILSAEGNHNQKWFVNNKTRDFLKSQRVTGVSFDDVLSSKNELPLSDVHQVRFDCTIPEEAVALGKEYGIDSVITCETCGEHRYYVNPHTYQLCLYEAFLGDKDAYVTEAVFGQGYGYRIVVVSKRFYKILKENDLIKCFSVHPVKVLKSNND